MSFERDHDDHVHRSAATDPESEPPGRRSATDGMIGGHGAMASGLIQRQAERDANGVAAGAEAAVHAASSSTGSSLPVELQRKFEGSLGADLSTVRVHTDTASADAAQAVGARAYAVGQDVHFGAGQYDPSSAAGQHLIAHEVAHTVQQQGGAPTRQHKLEVSSVGDHAEVEADAAADAMIAGHAFAIGAGGGGVSRSAIFRDKDKASFPPTPSMVPPDDGPSQSQVATAAEQQAARDKIADASTEAHAALVRVVVWTIGEWNHFVSFAAESPSVVWDPGMLKRGLAKGATMAIGAATAAAAKGAQAALPEVGMIVGKFIELLGGGLGDAAKEKIEGGKEPKPQEASHAGRQAMAAALAAKLPEVQAKAEAQCHTVGDHYKAQGAKLGSRFMDKGDVDAMASWAQADAAASKGMQPAGHSLSHQMLMSWVGHNMFDDNKGKSGTNQESYKAACAELFGADRIPGMWGMQLRNDWRRMGLPTAKADAWAAGAGGPPSGEVWFDTAENLEALATAFTRPNTGPFLHIVNGGAFKLRCGYKTAVMAKDVIFTDGYVYLDSAHYQLTTEGMQGGDQVFVVQGKAGPHNV